MNSLHFFHTKSSKFSVYFILNSTAHFGLWHFECSMAMGGEWLLDWTAQVSLVCSLSIQMKTLKQADWDRWLWPQAPACDLMLVAGFTLYSSLYEPLWGTQRRKASLCHQGAINPVGEKKKNEPRGTYWGPVLAGKILGGTGY